MANIVHYYIDNYGNYYIDNYGNKFIAGTTISESPTKLNYIRYKPYIYNKNNNSFVGYTAFIRQADGSYIKLKPYIYTSIEMAIAGLAIAGISRVADVVNLKSSDNFYMKDINGFYLTVPQ